MNWKDHINQNAAGDIEDLAYPPSGGKTKIIFLGILLPLVIAYFAANAWLTETATWFGKGNSDVIVHGPAAKSLAVAFLSVALFCHFRWCWGLIPYYRVFEVGTIVSLLGIVGGVCYGFYTLVFY